MKLMTPTQMRHVDEKAIKDYGIPSLLLMEHAAYNIFISLRENKYSGRIVIVCGPGNNGGDGLALARQLHTWSQNTVQILMLAPLEKLSEEGKTYYTICQKLKISSIQVTESNLSEVVNLLERAEVIVDALLGTGLRREVTGIYEKVINSINRSTAHKVCIDIPSGIDGETGEIRGCCVGADTTITFALPKLGLYRYPAIDYIGKLQVVDIGIPKEIIEKAETTHFSIEQKELGKLLPKRPTRSNKGTYGKVLVIGGKTGLSGAPTLTGLGAFKVGCGTVTVAVPRAIHDIMEQKLTEVMTIPLMDEEGHFGAMAASEVKKIIEAYDIIVVGPGIGRSKEIHEILLTVLASSKPCVIDADALYFLKEMLEVVKLRNALTIITPHPGEMARLTGLGKEEILQNPIKVARDFATQNNVITVLKIERTVVADTKGNIYINTSGNTGMAKGGSGDLLTGILAGLMAQHIEPIDAACLGVYIHGRAADIMANKKTQYTILPSDLFEGIDEAFQEILAY